MFNFLSIYFLISALLLAYLSYRFAIIKSDHFRLYGVGLGFISLAQFCALAVSMLWIVPFINPNSLYGVSLVFALLAFLSCVVSFLPEKIRKLSYIFLVFCASIVAGIYIINPILSGPTIYELRYIFSFDNSMSMNSFGLAFALAMGLATLSVAREIKNPSLRFITEFLGLIVIVCLTINMISTSNALRLTAGAVLSISLVALAVSCNRLKLSVALKSKPSSNPKLKPKQKAKSKR